MPGPQCHHYRIELLTIEGRQRQEDALKREFVLEVPWCAHPKHSPLSRATALSLGNIALRCDGRVSRCPLSPGAFADCG